MNTAGSVVYGWGVLIAAAGVSFYYAKKEIDGRRRVAQANGTRTLDKLGWEERIAMGESTKQPSVVDTLKPGSVDKPPGAGGPSAS